LDFILTVATWKALSFRILSSFAAATFAPLRLPEANQILVTETASTSSKTHNNGGGFKES
jgi:hypothetical protein